MRQRLTQIILLETLMDNRDYILIMLIVKKAIKNLLQLRCINAKSNCNTRAAEAQINQQLLSALRFI